MDLEEVKTCLRALLSSTPFTYDVNHLLKDFRETTGRTLPLFGCLYPVEFLKTLDDTVQLFGDSYNPKVALIKSDKSAHIISLVDKQRKKSNTNKHLAFTTKQKRFTALDRNTVLEKENKNSVFPKSQYNDLEAFTLQTTTALSSQTFTFDKTKETDSNKVPSIYFTYNTKNLTQEEFHVPVKSVAPVPPISNRTFNNSGLRVNESPDVGRANGFCLNNLETCVEVSNSRPKCSESICGVSENLRNKLRRIIKKHPEGLWCCELPKLFLDEFNFVLDYREFGYTSLIQMVSKLSDVFRCVRPGNEDWILFDASVDPSPEEIKMMEKQSTADITCELNANVKILLFNCFESASDSGIEMDKVLELYEKMFGRRLDFESLGFKDPKSLFKTWEGTLLNMLEINGKTILEPVRRKTHLPVRWEKALPPITAENDIFAEIFPKDVIGPNEKLTKLDLTRHVAVGHVVQVCAAEVWSPGKFYLQLHKFKKSLNRLMDDLQKFYSVHLNKYKMPEATIRPNQICVGLYNSDPDFPDEWHRAEILKVINEKLVLVNCVDYGTVTRVKKSQLRFLHRSFQSFPVLGFLAHLSGVVPPNGQTKWPMSTSKKFLELLRVPYLNAKMIDIDFKTPKLSVILYDPLQKPVRSINQKLIFEKLACAEKTEGYFDLSEEKPETPLKDSKTETKILSSFSSNVPGQENYSKNLPDEFSAIVDLDQPNLLFDFKMVKVLERHDFAVILEEGRLGTSVIRLKLENPSPAVKKEVENKTENLNYEFEDVQDLDLCNGAKENVDDKDKKESTPDDIFEVTESSSTPEIKCPDSFSMLNGESKKETSQPNQSEFLPSKSNRFPPGLEHVSPDFDNTQLFIKLDLKKKINILAMELLATNPSIKKVGLSDPGLALKIAIEMAEIYVTSEYARNLPYTFNPMLSFLMNGFDLSSQPDVQPTKEKVSNPLTETTKATDDITSEDKAQAPPPEENKCIREIRLGEKTVHLITIDNELYFCAEEIVRKLTFINSREAADRVLLLRKIHTDYRILTKKDEKIVKAIKSQLLVAKKKSKKLQIHLISIKKVIPYLQALGGRTQSFEEQLLELQTVASNQMIVKPELP